VGVDLRQQHEGWAVQKGFQGSMSVLLPATRAATVITKVTVYVV
jgi:hypothetical protein